MLILGVYSMRAIDQSDAERQFSLRLADRGLKIPEYQISQDGLLKCH